MTGGSESERFVSQFHRFLKVLQLPCLQETRVQVYCEAVEGVRAIGMTRRLESERFAVQFHRFLKVLRLSCLQEMRVQVHCKAV